MWFISGKISWLPLYVLILVLIIVKYRRFALLVVPVLLLSVVLTDQLSVHAFKEVFQRLRPCHEPSMQGLVHIVNGKCGGMYGFVSSHAANVFGIAILSLGLLQKKWYSIMIIGWASLVAYSRVYLGVHYPGDIIGGGLLGVLIGFFLLILYRWMEAKIIVRYKFFGRREPDENY